MSPNLLAALDKWRHHAQGDPATAKLLIRALDFCALGKIAGEVLRAAATTDTVFPDWTGEEAS